MSPSTRGMPFRRAAAVGIAALAGCTGALGDRDGGHDDGGGGDDDVVVGGAEGYVTEVFRQEWATSVDVLWVVDDSASMGGEQDAIADHAASFFDGLAEAGVDFHVGIVTTDVEDPSESGSLVGPFLTSGDVDPAPTFASQVRVGTDGSGTEQGLEAARRALTEPLASGDNDGFLRDDAPLAVVCVSDEEDYSPDPVDAYLESFLAIESPLGFQAWRDDRAFRLLAVVGPSPGGCEPAGAGEYPAMPGTRYLDVADRTGGGAWSICDVDSPDVLLALAHRAAGERQVFQLASRVVVGDVTVWVDGVPASSGWTYRESDASVRFEDAHVPESGAMIEVTYRTWVSAVSEPECADSSECPVGQFCQPETGECVVGCWEDGDCPAVARCDEHGACVEPDCRTTALDCSTGEVCDPGTGACLAAEGDHCLPCELDGDCGEGENLCLDVGAPDGQRYCFIDCASGPECPRGYSCIDVLGGGGSPVGEVCFAECWML